MMKATNTQFKKWGFLKQIKKFHIALGVIALGSLTAMLFFQNCSDSGNVAGLSPEPDKNLMSAVMASTSSPDHLDFLNDLENRYTISIDFCNAYRTNDPELVVCNL